MALQHSNGFDSFIYNEKFVHFEQFGVGCVVNFEVACSSCVNLRGHSETSYT